MDLSSWPLLIVTAMGLIILVAGVFKLAYLPLSVGFEIYTKLREGTHTILEESPRVSIIVPAYNEDVVLGPCVESILASRWSRKEVILIDDGSTDQTAHVMADFARRHSEVAYATQTNAGKGAALNRGIAMASGDVLFFVDADGLFQADTIEHMLRGFDDARVGAVCGDDRPVNLDRVLTRLLTLISHIGTGLVRRSLTVLHCMPIVSGNSGAFLRRVIEEIGPFDTDTVGEDLELTWRVHRAGYRVNFTPRALVYAESPSSVIGLWKQRVRWARGLLQTTWMHRTMVGNLRYGAFGIFLVFNTVTMILVPVLQLLVLLLMPSVFLVGDNPLPSGVWAIIGWLGLWLTLVFGLLGVALNRAWTDLRHFWTLPLWPLYSVFVAATMAWAIVLELAKSPNRWNKLTRTGVVSVDASFGRAPAPTDDGPAEVSFR